MFLIDIQINTARVPADRADEYLARHRQWFKTNYDAGHFLMVGPYTDKAGAGLILANTMTKDELNAILAGDAYYAEKLATYTVSDWHVTLFHPSTVDAIKAQQ